MPIGRWGARLRQGSNGTMHAIRVLSLKIFLALSIIGLLFVLLAEDIWALFH